MAVRRTASTGGKPDKLMRDALMLSLHREAAKGVKTKRLQLVAERLVDAAIEGDMAAVKEIFDRVDGKVPQAHVGDDGPIKHELVLRWMTPEIAKAHGLG